MDRRRGPSRSDPQFLEVGFCCKLVESRQVEPGVTSAAGVVWLGRSTIGVYPYILPGRDPALGLSVADAAAPAGGLRIGLYWWIPGILLVGGYFAYVYSRMSGQCTLEDDSSEG